MTVQFYVKRAICSIDVTVVVPLKSSTVEHDRPVSGVEELERLCKARAFNVLTYENTFGPCAGGALSSMSTSLYLPTGQ